MKKNKILDPFKIRERKEGKVNHLMETMELLARVVDDKLYSTILVLDMERPYTRVLDDIWSKVEEMKYEDAKEILYSLAVLLDDDARFILEHMVYPNKKGIHFFFDYFCEYLADGRIIDYQIYRAERPKEFADIEQIQETEIEE